MKIVCLEGCSGTGKTTQYHILNEYFKKNQYKHLSVVEKNYEPFKTAVSTWHKTNGPNIIFTENDVKNFALARAETFRKNFKSLENKIDLLILDRYFYTSAIYQRNSGLSSEEILRINKEYGSPTPNTTFIFDCDSAVCFDRIKNRNAITGGKSFFSVNVKEIEKIREGYLNFAVKREEIKIIDADKPIEKVTDEILFNLIKKHL